MNVAQELLGNLLKTDALKKVPKTSKLHVIGVGCLNNCQSLSYALTRTCHNITFFSKWLNTV